MSSTTVRAHPRHTARGLLGFVREHVRSGHYGVVSASKSNLSNVENHLRTVGLRSLLTQAGYEPLAADGLYTHQEGPDAGKRVRERSLFVPDLKVSDALKFGRHYDQESVLVGARLLSSHGGRVMLRTKPADAVFGEQALKAPFATVVKRGVEKVAFSVPAA